MTNKIIAHIVHFFLAYLSFAISAHAQDVDTILRHRLFITAALNHVDTHDEQASPLLYFGNGNPIGFGYEYRGNSYRHSLRFSFSVSNFNANELQPDLQNDPFGRRTFFTNGFLTYSYVHDWTAAMDGKLQYSYGLAFDNIGFIRVYKYYGGDLYSSDGAGTWEELNILSPMVRIDYDMNSHEKLHSELLLPFVSIVGRSAYNLRTSNSTLLSGKDFHLVFLGGLLGWNYSLTFEQKVLDALLMSVSYDSRYYRYTRYDWTTAVLMQDVALQLSWRFGL